jgi:outer membrane protein TolC
MVWTLVLTAGAVGAPLSAQQPPAPAPAQQPAPAPTTAPAGAAAGATSPAAAQAALNRYVVGQAVPTPAPGTTLMNLTLEQAMQIALEKNLDLKVARMNPPAVDYQLAAARAAFQPQFTGTYSYNSRTTATNDTVDLVSFYAQKNQSFNGGLTESTPWYGGRFSATFNNGRQFSTNPRNPINPSFTSNLSFNYTQPLLAGRSIDNNRNQLRTLAVQRQISDIQLVSSIENTKASVRTAYWNLRQAIEQIRIQELALDLAQRLFQDNKTKVEIGTLAPIDTVTPEAQVATAEQNLLNAQIQWTTAELTLKRLLADSPEDAIYQSTINPTEQPTLSVQRVDIASAVRTALGQRTDLEQSRRNIEVSRLNLDITRDVLKPQLDLQAGYSAAGQAGRNVENLLLSGGYGDAVSQVFARDLPTWNMQFNVTYPLFMKAAKANFARAQLQLDQSQAQLKASELTVSSDVTNAGLAVENTYKQYQAAQKNSEAQQKNAEAEQTRFDVGMSTNYAVVQAQNALTQARLTELQRLIAYLNAVAEFDRIQKVGAR